MNGYGFHWSPCSGGGRGIAATGGGVLFVLAAAAYVVPRLAWVAGITAACVVLSVVLALTVVPRVARWSDGKDAAAYADQRPAWLAAQAAPAAPQRIEAAQPLAIEPARNELHLHFRSMNPAEVAEAIRQASDGR